MRERGSNHGEFPGNGLFPARHDQGWQRQAKPTICLRGQSVLYAAFAPCTDDKRARRNSNGRVCCLAAGKRAKGIAYDAFIFYQRQHRAGG